MATLKELKAVEDKQDRKTIRSAYGPKLKIKSWNLNEKGEVDKKCAIQAHKDECELKNIIKRHDKGELILNVQKAAAQYGDFSELNEFQESMNIVAKAKESFEAIPSHIRKRFGNDAGLFHEYVTDPKNVNEMIELGLAEAYQEQKDPNSEMFKAAEALKAAAEALPSDAEPQ